MVVSDENPLPKRSSNLLDKYRIPIQHFEYTYIETCNDGKELEKIVQVLRSGEEGYFPDLTRYAENRLAVIKPKSKLLRTVCPVISKELLTEDERNNLMCDLKGWISNVSKDDESLGLYKNLTANNFLPSIREPKEIQNVVEMPTQKRILATDYSSWDKYDPDAEILRMDLADENLKKSQKSTKKNSVRFKEFTTEIEAQREANCEKEKGNEFFKNGEYNSALSHYTNSINYKPSLACFNNRALTNIKLKKYQNAIDDCHSALVLEPNNLKALLRKSLALEGLDRFREALETIEKVIAIDPNSSIAQELAQKLSKLCGATESKVTRFVVEDVKKSDTIIPIAGTSNMGPPHYITSTENKMEDERNLKACASTQIIHLVSVENNECDDDDCCTVNHLKDKCSRKNDNREKTKNRVTEKVGKNRKLVEKVEEDKCAGGEPFHSQNSHETIQGDVHSPYNFLKLWNSASVDRSYEQHALILKTLDVDRIVNVIGCKLDNAMFSAIIKCLCIHFAVPGEVQRLHVLLANMIELPRFEIILMLMSRDDVVGIKYLVDFLKQHGKPLPENVINKYFNNYHLLFI